MKKTLALTLCAALLAAGLAACSAGSGNSTSSAIASYDTGDYYQETENLAYGEEAPGMSANAAKTDGADPEQGAEQKLIYTADARLETKDIEPALDYLYQLIDRYGCLVESEQVYNVNYKDMDTDSYRYSGGTPTAELSIRVPSAHFNDFISGLKADTDLLYVQRISSTEQNMTRTYYDVQARVEALKSEEAWLLDFMQEAETVSEMLEIKDRLTEVQYEIDRYSTQVRAIDYDVAYSTVNIDLVEVQSYTERAKAGFWERFTGYLAGSGSSFLGVAEGALETLIYLLPYLLIGGLIAFVIVRCVRAANRCKAEKFTAQTAASLPRQDPAPAQQPVQREEKHD